MHSPGKPPKPPHYLFGLIASSKLVGGPYLIANFYPTRLHRSLTVASTGRHSKIWNINTPKFHSLGDVPSYIRMFGTTDSYSTQLVTTLSSYPQLTATDFCNI
jgi:hypothetical protein